MLLDNKNKKTDASLAAQRASFYSIPNTSSRLSTVLVLLLALFGSQSTEVGAFSSPSPLVTHHRIHQGSSSSITALSMARPGQSEAQARKEREDEIRQKLAQLKSSGKMKGGTASSMMDEAEKFFNKESPARKFELKNKKRKEEAAAAAALAEESSNDGSDNDASSPPAE
jgi:hypothetical protein